MNQPNTNLIVYRASVKSGFMLWVYHAAVFLSVSVSQLDPTIHPDGTFTVEKITPVHIEFLAVSDAEIQKLSGGHFQAVAAEFSSRA